MDLAKIALVASTCVFGTYWIAGVLVVGRFFDHAYPRYNAFLRSVVQPLRGPYVLAAIDVIVHDAFTHGWAYVLPEGLAFVICWLIVRCIHDDRWDRRRHRLLARVKRSGAAVVNRHLLLQFPGPWRRDPERAGTTQGVDVAAAVGV